MKNIDHNLNATAGKARGNHTAEVTRGPGAAVSLQPGSKQAIQIMLAGAQMRGMADMADMLGHGVVILDRTGSILHTSTTAQRMITGRIEQIGGTLIGTSGASETILSALTEEVLAGKRASGTLDPGDRTEPRLIVRALPVSQGQEGLPQLARAILLIESKVDQ